jgi:hypothetical protein
LIMEVKMLNQNSLRSGSALFAAALAYSFVFISTAAGQEQNNRTEVDARRPAEITSNETLICLFERPSQVQRYFVLCAEATELDVDIADCCVPGDHWEAKVKSWDEKPNTAVTTSPGPADVPGVPARVYTYEGPPENPGELRAAIECTYLHGVNLFPAESFLKLTPNRGSCSIEMVGLEDEIGRTP